MLLTKSPTAFARIALSVCREKLPARRTKHSRGDYSWPQMVACLLVKQFLRLDQRGLEILLREHDALRRALELDRAPDHTAYCRAMKHLTIVEVEKLLDETVVRLEKHPAPKLKGGHQKPTVALDSTGLRTDNASRSYFHKIRGKNASTRSWPKWSIAVDTQRHAIIGHVVADGPRSDLCEIDDLMEQAQRRRPSKIMVADAGFDAETTLEKCSKRWHVRGVVRVAPRGRQKNPQGVSDRSPRRKKLFENFPSRIYKRRKHVESTYSAHKRRFGDVVRSRTLHRRYVEQLLRAVLHNCAILLPRGGIYTSQQS